jgi:hypothetical protein
MLVRRIHADPFQVAVTLVGIFLLVALTFIYR